MRSIPSIPSIQGIALAFALPFLSAGCDSLSLNPYAVDAPTRIPAIYITTPSADDEVADSEYVIKVSFEKVIVDDTWSLYYVSDATDAKGAAIGADLPVTARTVRWDTSLMPSGHYFVFGELSSFGGIVTASAAGSIIVDHPVTDGNHSPTVRLLEPAGGEIFAPGTTQTISWSGSDEDGDTLTFDIDLSSDDGGTWEEIAADLSETSYEWTIDDDAPKSLAWRIRVRAVDSEGATGVGSSNRPFSIR